ncbi:PIN domain-like protein [Dothidotthia symphoricarpi CBS 119687]|uniref:PIN domain-like protein n=1 Tax=Dothidotthia symphoricarpi CBS 119687 TaxID=1392245 RepID=A0A6A6A746_9PLEO|nr:PIN domain-like protein [Dothidotthia symphoricarpi CBS 119687]KAF2126461.1 PIN domain-like protein [Dothidotthia symphoricarpi CBS 119687]
MIRDFEAWNANFEELGDLHELNGCRVGIEAADYLNHRILNHPRAKEPLVPALGGLPLALKQHIEEDLDTFASLQIEPRFVFSGIDIAKPDDPFRQKQMEAATNAEAWNLYDNHQAEPAVDKFGQSKYVTAEDLFRALQSVLVERNISFEVAPYSAWAQLAYLEKEAKVHAISGASEILLFECEKVITQWNFEEKTFYFTRRSKCIADLEKFAGNGKITEDIFVDALLLAGTSFLPTLPSLNTPNRTELLKPHSAIKMIMSNGRTGYSVVMNNREDPRFEQLNYLDRYRKARLAVKNHPIFTTDGDYKPLNSGSLPNDAHEYLGARLPNEVYYYLSQGLINARILQWRTTCEIYEVPPMDGVSPLRTAAINLLSSALHNWYRHKDLTLRCWFPDSTGKPQSSVISMKGLPETSTLVDTWNVKEATFKSVVAKHEGCGHLGAAILALQDTEFVPKTVGKKVLKNPLSSLDEIVYNSIWRFLASRDYIDANHNLTSWGKFLATVIASLKGRAELEDAAVLAVEMLRLGLLNGDINMFPEYNGAPMRGSQQDRDANMLISRIAGLSILHHRPIGFTGPLSQHLLGYNSIVNVVRQTLRDLIEVASTQMFLTACCDRKTDLKVVAMKLPFLLPNNCALSIAVKSYLDELLSNDADPTSPSTKSRVVETASTRYFPQSLDLPGDLQTAFALWDAIYSGVKAGGSIVPEPSKSLWTETNSWLAARR